MTSKKIDRKKNMHTPLRFNIYNIIYIYHFPKHKHKIIIFIFIWLFVFIYFDWYIFAVAAIWQHATKYCKGEIKYLHTFFCLYAAGDIDTIRIFVI